MKKFHIYALSTCLFCLCLIVLAVKLNVFESSSDKQKAVTESSVSNNTLSSNLDSIPNYIEPKVIEAALSPEQKKRLSNLNETQQKEALSAMGHQQGIKEMIKYGEIELDRLKAEDKKIAQKDKHADDIIKALNAEVSAMKAEPQNSAPN